MTKLLHLLDSATFILPCELCGFSPAVIKHLMLTAAWLETTCTRKLREKKIETKNGG